MTGPAASGNDLSGNDRPAMSGETRPAMTKPEDKESRR
jgi:hypothetical protein